MVFVDGDFWHGFRFDAWKSKLSEYWREKIERNRRRDRLYTARLRREGWIVVRVWERQVMRDIEKAVARVEKALATIGKLSTDA